VDSDDHNPHGPIEPIFRALLLRTECILSTLSEYSIHSGCKIDRNCAPLFRLRALCSRLGYRVGLAARLESVIQNVFFLTCLNVLPPLKLDGYLKSLKPKAYRSHLIHIDPNIYASRFPEPVPTTASRVQYPSSHDHPTPPIFSPDLSLSTKILRKPWLQKLRQLIQSYNSL
jgi:hypothetical protein